MRVSFDPATPELASQLLARGVRRSDCLEAARLGFPAISTALHDSLVFSEISIAASTKHGVACIFGVSRRSVLSDVGTIWLVAHTDIEKYAVRFLKETHLKLNLLMEYYPRLENIIDVDNIQTIKWLEWLGFTVDKTQVVRTRTGFPFYRFWKEA